MPMVKILDKAMKMNLTFLKYISLVFIFSAPYAAAQNKLQIDKEMKLAIEKVAGTLIPGLSVAVANSDGLLWSGVSGYSNIEDNQLVSQSHTFGIGNITNKFIELLILQMAEENILDLNSTPQSILGEKVSHIENADSATLFQLLNHTSGIYSWANDNDWQRRGRGIQMNPKYIWHKEEPLKYIAADQHPATHTPGTAYAYSNSNYTLLGLILEKISGVLLEDQVRSRILEPLNLHSTYYHGFELIPLGRHVGSYHLATDHFISTVGINAKFAFGQDQLMDTSGASLSAEGLAGGIVSTPRDIALFAMAIKNGKLLNKVSAEMLTNIHSDILGFTSDLLWLDRNEIVIVSFANLGTVGGSNSATAEYLNNYVERILLPIAQKYAK